MNSGVPPVEGAPRGLMAVVMVLWLCLLVAGSKFLIDYECAPGQPAQAPTNWPEDSMVPLAPGRPTLLMMAHPRCPCTRASISELARLMGRCQGQVSAHILFLRPKEFPEGWEQSDLWESAKRIPGVRVWSDSRGQEADRFGVATSGQVFLYDRAGRLLFSGGITISRGHQGDNAGRATLQDLILNDRSLDEFCGTSVYGCEMQDKGDFQCQKP